MTEDDYGYIYVVGWDKFQHYRDRRPAWIKVYPELVDNEEYAALNMSQRGLLHGIWMLTARVGNGRVAASQHSLNNALAITQHVDRRWTARNLERLNDAGFIRVQASKALANRYPRERERVLLTEEQEGDASADESAHRQKEHPGESQGRLPAKTRKQVARCRQLYHQFIELGDDPVVARGALEEMFRDPAILQLALPEETPHA